MASTSTLVTRTPTRAGSSAQADDQVAKPSTPRASAGHRLLFRGALALPDSCLQLEGIAFTAQIPPESPSNLLQSPLPLALESMRGRPLSLIGVVQLKDMQLEWTSEINMFVNPDAILTLGYFERNLCYDALDDSNCTTSGIRIGLGDTFDASEEDMIVFGKLSSEMNVDDNKATLQLIAARIKPKPIPVPPARRMPRPDDPSPRRPDVFSSLLPNNTRRGTNKHARPQDADDALERAAKKMKVAVDPKLAKAKELMLKPPPRMALNGKHMPLDIDDDGFRVPDPPLKRKAPEREKPKQPAPAPKPALSKKASAMDDDGEEGDEALIEEVNKLTIRQVASKALGQRGLKKDDPSFKDVFQWTIRGVAFAMRSKMSSEQISLTALKRMADIHADMYIGGEGGLQGPSS
ncbi:hypothetical protein AURDEDRAFT_184431 [Auricularia subglabra TFB-10046 SS5]|nr:hypothetical protein AURDEDRAFT_184431 [Auricularia subglabra TFB-10046 SS5]